MTITRGRTRIGALGASAALALAVMGIWTASPAGAAIPAGATVVGADATACGGTTPDFTTISAAVAAASPGATIYVCPGVYNESVVITKQLTLLGAQNGVAADDPTVRTDPSAESVIDAPVIASGATATSPIEYSAAVGGTVNGFTLEGGTGTDGNAYPGIMALYGSGTGSFTFVNNILTDNGEGMQFFTGATSVPTSVVSYNRFVKNNNDPADGKSGSGIFLSNGVPNNLTISHNYFDDNDGNGDINTTGAGSGCYSGPPSGDDAQNVVINDNTSVHDDGFENNFAVMFCTDGAKVTDNTVTYTDASDQQADSAIYLGGGDTDLTVSGNTLTGGAGGAGVSFNSDFYPQGTGNVISDNTISGHSNGIVVRGANPGAAGNNFPGPTDFTISGNTITGSATDGIWVQAGSAGSITGNDASGSGTNDCQDDTTGSGTANTADTWTGDIGSTASPAGICTAPTNQTPEFPFTPALPLVAFGLIGGGVWMHRRRLTRV